MYMISGVNNGDNKNEDDENKNVECVFGKVNDEICELSDISDWGQYIIIDD